MPAYSKTMTENQLHLFILEAAQWCGWTVHYIPDWMYRLAIDRAKKRNYPTNEDWADPGFPDLVIGKDFGDTALLLMFELKTEHGHLRPPQKAWAEILKKIPGIDYRVIRPRDLETVADLLSQDTGIVIG